LFSEDVDLVIDEGTYTYALRRWLLDSQTVVVMRWYSNHWLYYIVPLFLAGERVGDEAARAGPSAVSPSTSKLKNKGIRLIVIDDLPPKS